MKILFGLLSLVFVGLSQARQPNILLIVSDDMGYSDLGVHGCTDIPTPHMDSIARQGVRCQSGYVTAAQCSPSRAGLLTGKYQQRFGHEFNPNTDKSTGELAATEKTLADHLKAAGYTTGLFGKWHLGRAAENVPTSRGFDEFYGVLSNTNTYFRPRLMDSRAGPEGTGRLPGSFYLTTACGERAAEFVKRHGEKPFFLYLAFNAVHTPLEATPELMARVAHIQDRNRRTNAAMAVAMDDSIGRVLQALRDQALEEDTLVFFINDNGAPNNNAGINQPLRGFKGQTWEGGIRVPFLVQWKGSLPAGKVYDPPVSSLDILPTALAAAGLPADPALKLDGVNLLPYFKGDEAGRPHQALFWRAGDQMAIRMGKWKLVRAIGGVPGIVKNSVSGCTDLSTAQLINLEADPEESTDISASHPEQKQKLIDAWQKWNATLIYPKWEPRQE